MTAGKPSAWHDDAGRPRRRFILWALTAAIAGCASAPRPHDPEAHLKELAGYGYRPARSYSTAALGESWAAGDALLDVSVVAPSQEGRFPLVVYIPGLGESAGAGMLWRQAWAEAGYIVLTVQDTACGEAVWASAQARAGDFAGLARGHFSPASLRRRLDQLKFAVGEFGRRASAGKPPYAAWDRQGIVVAGFDLGARIAALLAGEQAPDIDAGGIGAAVRAAMLLSPYDDGREGPQRFAHMALPVLSVTASEDADPFGLVKSPARRLAAWEAMPPGNKYLLMLAGGSHSVLAGNGFAEPGPSAAPDVKAGGAVSPGAGGHQHIGESAAPMTGPVLRVGGHGGGMADDGGHSGNHVFHPRENLGPRAFDPRHVMAVRSVTTAFLDAMLAQDAAARRWLTAQAPRDLGSAARVESK